MKVKNLWLISIAGALLLTGLIFVLAPNLERFRAVLLPDKGPDWYYWKLPEINVWALVTAWGGYILHQAAVWFLLFKLKKEPAPASGNVGRYNIILLLANLFFILLHIAQTQVFYEGLAQGMPIMSSQGSVIVMLVMMLVLLNRQRGLFFGKKVHFNEQAVLGVQKTHGIFISWALVFTFWFHPTESTVGHLWGFFYMFLLMVQMSMAKTKIHFNIRWITVLEVLVALHGAAVAIASGNGMWQMFFFGFMMMFIVTQLYGLKWPRWLNISLTVLYFAGAVLVYSGLLGNTLHIGMIHQITWIPLILYLLVFALVFIYQFFIFIGKKFLPKKKDVAQ